jgi:hypothetical protein
MMLLWRCWHLRNDIIHDKGKSSIKHSVHFFLNYANSLYANLYFTSKNTPLDPKGKKLMGNHQSETSKETKKKKTGLQCWWLLRRWNWTGFDWSHNYFQNCCDAQESAALAAREGARLAAQWCNKPVIFESDCTTITQAIQSKEQHLSHLKSILHDFNLYVSHLIYNGVVCMQKEIKTM